MYTPLLSDRLCDPPGHRLVLAVLVVRKMGCPKGTLESEKISFVVAMWMQSMVRNIIACHAGVRTCSLPTNVLAHRVGK